MRVRVAIVSNVQSLTMVQSFGRSTETMALKLVIILTIVEIEYVVLFWPLLKSLSCVCLHIYGMFGYTFRAAARNL